METKATLVWAESAVELNTKAAIDLALALVVFPDYSKLNDALGNRRYSEGFLVFGMLLEEGRVVECGGEFWKGSSACLL